MKKYLAIFLCLAYLALPMHTIMHSFASSCHHHSLESDSLTNLEKSYTELNALHESSSKHECSLCLSQQDSAQLLFLESPLVDTKIISRINLFPTLQPFISKQFTDQRSRGPPLKF
jgi:hypothetical protein